ncbi:MAG: cation-translocating P-type ATPase, partial [Oscillospiraceae bacterium]
EAVKKCKKAGIRPIMITGDHIVTASAIAKELGILRDGDKAITGLELQKMSDDEFAQNIEKYSVYARVSPEDKIKIVKAWQKRGATVSMTGDGVNDAPALKAADIGCAMGITGTDVSKGAADMILTDDNFATIVVAVEQGRGIYDNIKKAIRFLIGCNLGEIFVVFFAMIFGWGNPLLPIQLLWINLVTDGLPALALGMEPAEDNVMSKKPKKKSESLFANGFGVRIVLEGLMVGFFTLVGFSFGYFFPGESDKLALAQTMAFIVLSMCEMFHIFNIRSSKSIFVSKPWKNKYLIGAVALSFILILGVVFIPPVSKIFGLVDVDLIHWMVALGCSLGTVVIMEISKLITRLRNKNKN